jgi:hypothetical protein
MEASYGEPQSCENEHRCSRRRYGRDELTGPPACFARVCKPSPGAQATAQVITFKALGSNDVACGGIECDLRAKIGPSASAGIDRKRYRSARRACHPQRDALPTWNVFFNEGKKIIERQRRLRIGSASCFAMDCWLSNVFSRLRSRSRLRHWRIISRQAIEKVVGPWIRHHNASKDNEEQRHCAPDAENVMPTPHRCAQVGPDSEE